MIYGIDDLRQGFSVEADVVVVGSGAGGAVAAANFAAAGLRTIVLEAGPKVRNEDMTRNAPEFLRKYYWEAGVRMLLGSGAFPCMSGRCLGGTTVINSAIMFKLPDWVRTLWIAEDGLPELADPALDAAYERVFAISRVEPTPMEAMGRRNLLTRDILQAAGMKGAPLPRAVQGCEASSDCLTGCAAGAKKSVDRTYLPRAVHDGAEIFTCASVERVLMEGGRAVGVTGYVVDPETRVQLAPFTVRAARVVLAAGALHTPVLMLRSGITGGGTVGGTFQAHISSVAMGFMDEVVDPWVGATQGWGAFSDRVPGMKFEALWGPTSLIAAQWSGLGPAFYEILPEVRRVVMIPLVYRANVTGRVRARSNGLPDARLWIPKEEMWVVMRELKRVVDAMLQLGAEFVFTGVRGVPDKIRTAADAELLLSSNIRPRHIAMTANHVFGSCRMSSDPRRGVVDASGKVHGVDGLWICDASIFPSPSAVNPQATVMALSDVISRRMADLDLHARVTLT
jgi:choline dehydrogenase-like flavoprotein